MAPGETFRVTLDCRRHGVDDGDFNIGFTVRSTVSEKPAFATSTTRFSVVLPQADAFRVSFELKCNLGGGVYYVDAHAYDRVRDIAVHGPRSLLTVAQATTFIGTSYLEPRVSVSADAVSAPAPAGAGDRGGVVA